MWDPEARYPRSAFLQAIAPPSAGPFDAPTVCLEVNQGWLAVICGALWELGQAPAVVVADSAALADWQGRLTDLMAALFTAGECMQAGIVTVTIAAGQAVGTVAVVFPTPVSVAPVVVVSEGTGDYIASTDSITATGFTADITASVSVIADSPSVFSWIARVAT